MNENQRIDVEDDIGEIIAKIQSSEDEKEVIELTERFSKEDSKVHVAGITRWGELRGLEGEVVGFEVRKTYELGKLFREYSLVPVDGRYRTRNVITGSYADSVKTMGPGHGLKAVFEVVYDMGRKLYGNRFTPEMAKAAFITAFPTPLTDSYLGNVEGWFHKLSNKKPR